MTSMPCLHVPITSAAQWVFVKVNLAGFEPATTRVVAGALPAELQAQTISQWLGSPSNFHRER